jgi:arginine decarboxylase
VPYPPGIPVLVPGQVVEPPVLAYLVRLLQTQRSIELHGLATQDGEWHLRVLSAAERTALPTLAP